MNKLRVSVAVCTYNGARYIREQLESILSQTRPPDQIVVRDDGSTDGTADIVREIAKSAGMDFSFEINPDNLGVTRNFQRAIDDCSGDVVFLSDQDDVWHANKIERMLEPFQADPDTGLAYCDAVITDGNLAPSVATVFGTCGRAQIWRGNDRDPLELLKRPGVKGCTMAVSGRLLRAIFPIPEIKNKCVWSHDYWIAAMAYGLSSVVVIDEPLMFYRVHGGNVSGLQRVNQDAAARVAKPYVSRYSSSRVRARVGLYQNLIAAIDGGKGISLADNNHVARFMDALRSELSLLSDRLGIWQERRFFARLLLSIQFLKNGRYRRFKKGNLQFIKDILGRKP